MATHHPLNPQRLEGDAIIDDAVESSLTPAFAQSSEQRLDPDEVAKIRAQFGALLDLYTGCIDYVGHYGLEASIPDELLDSLCVVMNVRKRLGLGQPNETKCLTVLRRAGYDAARDIESNEEALVQRVSAKG